MDCCGAKIAYPLICITNNINDGQIYPCLLSLCLSYQDYSSVFCYFHRSLHLNALFVHITMPSNDYVCNNSDYFPPFFFKKPNCVKYLVFTALGNFLIKFCCTKSCLIIHDIGELYKYISECVG